VALVETIAGKLFHQVKNFVSFVLDDGVFGRTVTEDLAVSRHFIGVFFTHGAAQHVGTAQAVAAQNLRGLHHLLLVDHDAVGLGEHLGHQRVRVDHLFPPVFARHKTRDQVHRAGAVQALSAIRSSSRVGLASRNMPCMPRDSNWNTASVLPS
jgi:hypothetical protein